MSQELIPFDLEKALAGDVVVTASGHIVTEIHQFKTDSSTYNVCAIINSCSYWFDENGVFNLSHYGDMNLYMSSNK